MRILVDGLPRTTGGIGSLVMNIAEFSQKVGDKDKIVFEFIIAGRSGYTSTLKSKGYKYYIAPPIRHLFLYMRFVNDLFNENSYDFLWFNNTSKVNIILPFFAKKAGVKVIAHPHGVDIEEKGIKRLLYKLLNRMNRRKMFSLIDIPLACSVDAAKVYYKGDSSLYNRVTIINNGISVEEYTFSPEKRNQIREKLGISSDVVLLGAVGRLTKVKNYPFLIDLIQILPEKYMLIILGDGEEKNSLSNLIAEKQLESRCMLLGLKKNVPDYLSAMDIFLLPSINEGFPFSIIEAQCEGLPCVISNTLSQELKISDLVSYYPLDKIEEWRNAILNLKSTERKMYSQIIYNVGFSIELSYQDFLKSLGDYHW